MTTPVFILSLPRAGSTLLQRMLMSHPQVAGVATECWVLLPWLYARRPNGVRAEYDHQLAAKGMHHLIEALPGGEADYEAVVRDAAQSLYDRVAGPDADLFVDKTPYYYRIIPEIGRMFPDAKLVFLLRNPLSVLASALQTFAGDDLRHAERIEHYVRTGPTLLARGYRALQARSCVVRYEDLVQQPEVEIGRLCAYLGVPADPRCWQEFQQQPIRMGDPNRDAYRGISDRSDVWRDAFGTRLRRSLARRYAQQVDGDYLELCGLDRAELVREVEQVPTTGLGASDGVGLASMLLSRWAKRRVGWLPRDAERWLGIGDRQDP